MQEKKAVSLGHLGFVKFNDTSSKELRICIYSVHVGIHTSMIRLTVQLEEIYIDVKSKFNFS